MFARKRHINVVVIGNSVGLFVRPPINKHEGGNYCKLLSEMDTEPIDIYNLSRASETVRSALKNFYERIFIFYSYISSCYFFVNSS